MFSQLPLRFNVDAILLISYFRFNCVWFKPIAFVPANNYKIIGSEFVVKFIIKN